MLVLSIFSQWSSTHGTAGCTPSMSSSMWSLQVNSEKFTKYLSKILSVDLQQIVDTKASELMHKHCDRYATNQGHSLMFRSERATVWEFIEFVPTLLEFFIALFKLFSFETWNPFKPTNAAFFSIRLFNDILDDKDTMCCMQYRDGKGDKNDFVGSL